MNVTKIISILIGGVFLLTSLATSQVNALGVGSMTMEGAHSNNGHFSVIVYENSGNDTVVGAGVVLSFGQPVSNLSYDYSVGPFRTTDNDGIHLSNGPVTGSHPLARVTFTLKTPGTVIADVATSSYLKHVEGYIVQDLSFEKGQAHFTYTPPAAKQPTPTTPKVSSTSITATGPDQVVVEDAPAPLAQTDANQDQTGQVASAATIGKQSSKSWLLWLLITAAAAAGAYYVAYRRHNSNTTTTTTDAPVTPKAKKISNKK